MHLSEFKNALKNKIVFAEYLERLRLRYFCIHTGFHLLDVYFKRWADGASLSLSLQTWQTRLNLIYLCDMLFEYWDVPTFVFLICCPIQMAKEQTQFRLQHMSDGTLLKRLWWLTSISTNLKQTWLQNKYSSSHDKIAWTQQFVTWLNLFCLHTNGVLAIQMLEHNIFCYIELLLC